jgi:hypothetical protein
MDFGSVNWIGVIVCVVLNFAVGFVWYSPKVFFNVWWRALGKGDTEMGNAGPTVWGLTFVAAVVEAVAVSFMLTAMGSTTLASGLLAGFMIWFGFVATTHLVNNLFAGRPFKVWAIEAGNHLIYLLITGAVLSVWR